MAKLNINWRSLDGVAPKGVVTGKSAEESANAAAATMRAERPMLVWVMAEEPDNKDTRKLESVVFVNESVSVGAKFFDTIKVQAGSALQDRILNDAGNKTPRLVLLDREYKVAKVLQGSGISSGKLIKAMKFLARSEYETTFDTMVRDYIKLLNELDRLEGRRAKLADDRERLAAKPNPSKERRVARDEKEYQADMEAWNQEEAKLRQLRRKGEEEPKTET